MNKELKAWFTVDELNAWAEKKLKENPQWAEQPATVREDWGPGPHEVHSLPAEQPAQQEPVACANGCRGFVKYPAQRKPLTDEQWQEIADTLGCFMTRSEKEIIEAALGIKENT